MMGNREDDKFLRKIIWYLGGVTLVSATAIGAMQVQINANKEAVKEIKETNKTLNQINLTLQKVHTSGINRNNLLVAQAKKQEAFEERQLKIYGEQEKRRTTVYDAAKHMKNRRVHK